jgi:hypothetical protein
MKTSVFIGVLCTGGTASPLCRQGDGECEGPDEHRPERSKITRHITPMSRGNDDENEV